MEAVARLKNHPTSPRKMRMVVDTIRGLDVDKALNVLKYIEKAAARPLEKLLLSALNNWVAKNEGVRIEEAQLYIKTAYVDSGRTLKRFRPAPMGRAYRIRKRSNHVTLIIDSRLAPSAASAESQQKIEKSPTLADVSTEAAVGEENTALRAPKKVNTKKEKKQ